MKLQRMIGLLGALLWLTLATARADQLQAVPLEDARRIAASIGPDTFLVSYASMADEQPVEVWRVRDVVVAPMDQKGDLGADFANLYEVRVFGRKLWQTVPLKTGEYREPLEFARVTPDESDAGYFLATIDAAYVYVLETDGSYRALGKKLEMPNEVRVERITLPESVTAALTEAYPPEPQGE